MTEDGLKYEPAATAKDAKALGIDAVRVTLTWRPGLDGARRRDARAARQRDEQRPGCASCSPCSARRRRTRRRPSRRAASTAASSARSSKAYPSIRDVVVWNEPNKELFWQPQFDASGKSAAPAAYEALLARCYDELHAARADVDVLAPSTAPRGNDRPNAKSNVSHSPVRFLEELGHAYRASGRDRPIFDTLAHHVYGNSADEPPGKHHEGNTIGEGDYARLVATLRRAFGGTKQPVPGPIWYLEGGLPDDRRRGQGQALHGRGDRRGRRPADR